MSFSSFIARSGPWRRFLLRVIRSSRERMCADVLRRFPDHCLPQSRETAVRSSGQRSRSCRPAATTCRPKRPQRLVLAHIRPTKAHDQPSEGPASGALTGATALSGRVLGSLETPVSAETAVLIAGVLRVERSPRSMAARAIGPSSTVWRHHVPEPQASHSSS